MSALVAMLQPVLLAGAVWLGPDQAPLPFRDGSEATAFLREAKLVTVVKKHLGGTTGARKVLVERGGVRAHAVFRSIEREYYNTEWTDGQYLKFLRDSWRNEIAAYELSLLLGVTQVPPTVPWRMGRTRGSLQLWIEKARPGYARSETQEPRDAERWEQEREAMRAFDELIENVDRNIGNMLIDETGRVWWIDHTRSFGRETKIRRPDRITRCDRRFYERLKSVDGATIADRLGPYLTPRETKALLERRLNLIELIDARIAALGEEAVLFTRQ